MRIEDLMLILASLPPDARIVIRRVQSLCNGSIIMADFEIGAIVFDADDDAIAYGIVSSDEFSSLTAESPIEEPPEMPKGGWGALPGGLCMN